jgi:hypothetical protein
MAAVDLYVDARDRDAERDLSLAELHWRLGGLFEMALRQRAAELRSKSATTSEPGPVGAREILVEVVASGMPKCCADWPNSASWFLGSRIVASTFNDRKLPPDLAVRLLHAANEAAKCRFRWPEQDSGPRVIALLQAPLATNEWTHAIDGLRLEAPCGRAAFLFAGILLQNVRNTIVHSIEALACRPSGVTVRSSQAADIVLTAKSLADCMRLTAGLLHAMYA